jgi:prephenate dehydrogenase
MSNKPDELEIRVANRKRQLITEIIEHKKNSSRSGAAEAIDRIKDQLSELSQILGTDKWAHLTAGARSRLAEWIAR